EIPYLRPFKHVGERCTRFELERYVAFAEPHRRRLIGRVDLDVPHDFVLQNTAYRLSETDERRYRDFDARWDACTGSLGSGAGPDGLHLGGERRTNAWLAIAVGQSAHDEVAHRDEVCEAVATPKELRGINRQDHLAEGQRFRASCKENFAAVGRSQPPANPPIVEVHG